MTLALFVQAMSLLTVCCNTSKLDLSSRAIVHVCYFADKLCKEAVIALDAGPGLQYVCSRAVQGRFSYFYLLFSSMAWNLMQPQCYALNPSDPWSRTTNKICLCLCHLIFGPCNTKSKSCRPVVCLTATPLPLTTSSFPWFNFPSQ